MKKPTWKEKFQYQFDNLMSKGTVSLIGILFAITVIVVVLAGVIAVVTGVAEGMPVGKSVWMSLMHAIDAGTIAGDEACWQYLAIMMVVTVCGLFITSMLIGILNTGLEEKMVSLRKGKSIVLEKNHVVILGFNENALNIISRLIMANANHKHEVVVVMDDMDKTEMEDLIHQRIPDTGTTRVICRSGQVDQLDDLSMCSLETCRSVILNLEEDAQTIKSILACVHILEQYGNTSAYLVAMIRDDENLEAARIAGGDYVELLYFKRTLARLMAHASRQPGISTIFTSLLDYDGDEIYVESIEGTAGKTVSELNLWFPKSTVIGIVSDGISKINPPADTVLKQGDQVIIIEEDDGVSRLQTRKAEVRKECFSNLSAVEEFPLHALILGNGDLLELVLEELDSYVQKGSVIVVASPDWEGNENLFEEFHPKNLTVEQKTCDIYSKQVMAELLETKPENVLILTDSQLEDEEADARTLMLLLQLSSLSKQMNGNFTVTSEMRKVRNQSLARMTRVNDFVISSNITGLMMTQISQIRQQREFWEDLLDEEGSEFYRKPVSRYVKCGEPVDFYTVGASAARYGEIAIGYQTLRNGEMQTVCNPLKTDEIVFEKEDALLVIAED